MSIVNKSGLTAHRFSNFIWGTSLICGVVFFILGLSLFALISVLIAFASSVEIVKINTSLTSYLFVKIVERLEQSTYWTKKSKKILPLGFRLLSITNFIFSSKTQKDTFEPIVADWQKEYFEALFKKEIWKARWITFRYTYAFIVTMWQKSPIGDLIELIKKIAS